MFGSDLFDASVGIGIVAIGAAGGAAGATAEMVSALGASSDFAQSTYDLLETLNQQSADVQMLTLSFDVLGQATISSRLMADNAKNGLMEVVSRALTQTPSGSISVQHFAQGNLQNLGFSPRWFTTAAYAEATIQNTGFVAATYKVEAAYANIFTTVHLPIHGFGIGERDYSLMVLSQSEAVEISPGQQQTVQINYGAQVPDGDITYYLVASTSDGTYLQDTKLAQFGTTLVFQNGQTEDHSQVPEVILGNSPLNSSLTEFGNSPFCRLSITVENPLEDPVLIDLQQPFPIATTVIDAGGGTTNGNQIDWELNLGGGGIPNSSGNVQSAVACSHSSSSCHHCFGV